MKPVQRFQNTSRKKESSEASVRSRPTRHNIKSKLR